MLMSYRQALFFGCCKNKKCKCGFEAEQKQIMKINEVGAITGLLAEVATCSATISLMIALAPQLFLNDCADTCAASILAILSAIVQAQIKYNYEQLFFNQM